jgi:DNA-binding response OmpR family regulator
VTVQRILVVDDEKSILKIVSYALSEEGFEVHTASDVPTALETFAAVSPALVILDVVLKGASGLDLARELRSGSDVPIIILSARSSEVDRILGLEFGADDYVTKPFSPRELVSRVKAILRRMESCADEKESIQIGDLAIDTLSRQVHVSGTEVHLTRTEYDILLYLARHPGEAFVRDAIVAAVGESAHTGDERAIDVHIHNLREKLEPDPRNPAYILTVRGFGYRLREA